MFVLEVPGPVETLYSHTEGVVTVLAVDGIDGLGERRLSVPVNDVKETGLYGIVTADVTDDDTCILVMIDTVALPHGTELLGGQ